LNHQPAKRLLKKNGESQVKICALINSVLFFISWVYIIEDQGSFRLIANLNGALLIDKKFRTLRGAKIAFYKLFKSRRSKNIVKAEWSFFYEPDIRWFSDKIVAVSPTATT
jgi:hypothetical protein